MQVWDKSKSWYPQGNQLIEYCVFYSTGISSCYRTYQIYYNAIVWLLSAFVLHHHYHYWLIMFYYIIVQNTWISHDLNFDEAIVSRAVDSEDGDEDSICECSRRECETVPFCCRRVSPTGPSTRHKLYLSWNILYWDLKSVQSCLITCIVWIPGSRTNQTQYLKQWLQLAQPMVMWWKLCLCHSDSLRPTALWDPCCRVGYCSSVPQQKLPSFHMTNAIYWIFFHWQRRISGLTSNRQLYFSHTYKRACVCVCVWFMV